MQFFNSDVISSDMDHHGLREVLTAYTDIDEDCDLSSEEWHCCYDFVIDFFKPITFTQCTLLESELDVIAASFSKSRSFEARLFRQWYKKDFCTITKNTFTDGFQLFWRGKIRDVFAPTCLKFDRRSKTYIEVDNIALICDQMLRIVRSTAIYSALQNISLFASKLGDYADTEAALAAYLHLHNVCHQTVSSSRLLRTFVGKSEVCEHHLTMWRLQGIEIAD